MRRGPSAGVLGKTCKMLADEKRFPKVHPGREEEKWSHYMVELKEGQSQIRTRITWCSLGWATRRPRLTAYRAFFFLCQLGYPFFFI